MITLLHQFTKGLNTTLDILWNNYCFGNSFNRKFRIQYKVQADWSHAKTSNHVSQIGMQQLRLYVLQTNILVRKST